MSLTSRPLRVPPGVVPDAGTRSFILGSTGSGKSTIGAAIVEQYMERHPTHRLVILDPKKRFEAAGDDWEAGRPVFPKGPHEEIIKRRRAVRVQGRYWRTPNLIRPQHAVSIFQGDDPDGLFVWLFDHASARKPILLYADETLDLIAGARASYPFRRLIQQGRAYGLGMVMINQRPKWIDKTMVSDVEYLYVGRLGYQDDARHVRKELVPTSVSRRMPEEMEQHSWFFVDRVRPARSRPFELEQEAA